MSGKNQTGAPPAPGVTLVTDQDIAVALQNILSQSNPNVVNFNGVVNLNAVVQQLESKLGLDLTHKLDFIRSHINHLFLQAQALAQAQAQAQAQARARAHIPPPQPQQHHVHHHHQQQQLKEHFDFQQNPNFPVYRPEQYSVRPPSQPQVQTPQTPKQPLPQPPSVAANVAASQAVAAAVEAPKGSAQTGKKRRGGPGGLNKLCGVSPLLQPIVGQSTLPRTEIVKQLWAYIRKNNLQDPNNKRKIVCNDELRLVFETDCTDMFKMNKLLAKHIIPLETTQSSKKPKVEMESGGESADSVPIVRVSEALANFLGTEEREMSQAEVLRQVWEYIKANQLEDPLNSISIHCDAKLRELFGCESISALGIPEMLARRHLSNKS